MIYNRDQQRDSQRTNVEKSLGLLKVKYEMRFGGANESFKTARLNDAHLFAVTRRHSVCTAVSSSLLSSLIYVCSFVPYLRMSRTDAHLAAIFLPGYISVLCNILRRYTDIRAHVIIFRLWIFYTDGVLHTAVRPLARQGWFARCRAYYRVDPSRS